VDRNRFNADPDPNIHVDADPNQDPDPDWHKKSIPILEHKSYSKVYTF
jgi:hypothetical protein